MKSILIALIIINLFSCQRSEFTSTPSGMEYKIISNGSGDFPVQGEVIKMKVKQVYNDTVLMDSHNSIAQYQPFDTSVLSEDAYKIFSKVKVGDSLVFRVHSDSAFKTNKPAFVKQDGWLTTYVKIDAIFRSDVEAKADLELEKSRMGITDPTQW